MVSSTALAAAALLLGAQLPTVVANYELDTQSQILAAAQTLAFDGMVAYEGNRSGHTPGHITEEEKVDGGYAWWNNAIYLTAFVEYFRRTGDGTYNKVVGEGLLKQAGESYNYHPRMDFLENKDQCSWAMAAVLAAESGLAKASDSQPDWLRIAQNAFDEEAALFDYEEKKLNYYTCGGGLRNAIDATGNFYYKDSFSNSCFMALGARLSKLTGDEKYAKYAERTWDWMWNAGFINHDNYAVLYGASTVYNCDDVVKLQFSGSAAYLTEATAVMFNISKTPEVWKDRTQRLVESTLATFFPKGVAIEPTCEKASGNGTCYSDDLVFKSILHRSLSAVTQLAPFTAEKTWPMLLSSARAAVAQCTGDKAGKKCGFSWQHGTYLEPFRGAMEQVAVLSAVSGLVVEMKSTTNSGSGSGSGSGGSGTGSADAPGGTQGAPNSGAKGLRISIAPIVLLGLFTGLAQLWY